MTRSFKELYISDLKRYDSASRRDFIIKPFTWFFRKSQTCSNRTLALCFKFGLYFIESLRLLEIPSTCKIGKGIFWGHFQNITINPEASIGNYCSIYKGVTIGQEMRGKRCGCPNIGDFVYIGINSTIVGNITIGNDVLIAPNTFVNKDIPSHSIVFGNPCQIKSCENATRFYIVNVQHEEDCN